MPVAKLSLMMDNFKVFPSWLLLVLVLIIQKAPELTAMPVGSESQLAQDQAPQPLTNADFGSCELDISSAAEPYDEDCPDGATGLLPCNPGQLKVKECITSSENLPRICDPCPQKFFQSNYNRCTQCHPCSECGPNEEIIQDCTDESDTVCRIISLGTVPPPTVRTSSAAPTTSTTPAISTLVPVETTPTNHISSATPTTPSRELNATLVCGVCPKQTSCEGNRTVFTAVIVTALISISIFAVAEFVYIACYLKKGNGRDEECGDVNGNNPACEDVPLVNGHQIAVNPDDQYEDQMSDQEECGSEVEEDGYVNVPFRPRNPARGCRGAVGGCPQGHRSGSPGHGADDPDAADAPDPASVAAAAAAEPIYASVVKSRKRGSGNSRADVPAGHGPPVLPPSSQRNRSDPQASPSASPSRGAFWKNIHRPFRWKPHRKKDIPLSNLGTKDTENCSEEERVPGEDDPFLPSSDSAGNAAGQASDPLNSPGPASGASDLNGNPNHAPVTATTGGEGSETGADYENLRSGGVLVVPHEEPEYDVPHEVDAMDPPQGMPSAESNGASKAAASPSGHDKSHLGIDHDRGPTTNSRRESVESDPSSASPSEDNGRSSCNDPAHVAQNASCEVENDRTLPRQTRLPADAGEYLPPSEVDAHPDVPKQLPSSHRSANFPQNAVGGSDDAHLPTHQAPPPDGASTTADAKDASEVGRCGDSDRGESDSGRENERATGKIGLDDAVSMKFLQRLAQKTSCSDVKKVCREFEIEEHLIEDLEQSKPEVNERKFELLKIVKRHKGDRLTYHAVIDCLNKIGNTHAADTLIKDFAIQCETRL